MNSKTFFFYDAFMPAYKVWHSDTVTCFITHEYSRNHECQGGDEESARGGQSQDCPASRGVQDREESF